MSTLRSTFHESWHRVKDARPRLRIGVRINRQHLRGQRWHVIEDSSSQAYFRMSDAAYRFVGLLDGRRTVGEAWELCYEHLGDDAPTQGEALGLLGQMWSANLLAGQLAPDVEVMLRRQQTRRTREVQNRLSSFLSMRMRIVDPDRFLSTLAPVAGWIFSPIGFIAWLVILTLGASQLAGRVGPLRSASGIVLSAENLPWLYTAFVLTKLVHELSHALACKVFAKREGQPGEVHSMGVMLLVLLPVPYVDATSAWALHGKWRRVIVGAAGMMAELAIASIALWVWAHAREGSLVHAVSYNVVFIAGVSTILFNANPLLRYDGYYMLSDLFEIPNLQQRARDHFYAFIKRSIWGARDAADRLVSPARSASERGLLIVYAIFSSMYRVVVTFAITVFVSTQLFFVGIVLGAGAIVMWVVLPLVRFVMYLISDPELSRVRIRAIATTLSVSLGAGLAIAAVPIPRSVRLKGTVQADAVEVIRARTPGFIVDIAPLGVRIHTGDAVVKCENHEARVRVAILSARLDGAQARQRQAFAHDPAQAVIENQGVHAIENAIESAQTNELDLVRSATVEGFWIPDEHARIGQYVTRGERFGEIVSPTALQIFAPLGQDAAALITQEALIGIEARPIARGQHAVGCQLDRITEPSSLGTIHNLPTDKPDNNSDYQLQVLIDSVTSHTSGGSLSPGLPVIVRVTLEPEPLGRRWYRWVLRSLQRRFGR